MRYFFAKSLIKNQIRLFRLYPTFRLFQTFRLSDSTALDSTQAITDTRVKYSFLANVNLIQPELIDSTVCEGQLNNIFRREVSWEIRIDHRLKQSSVWCLRSKESCLCWCSPVWNWEWLTWELEIPIRGHYRSQIRGKILWRWHGFCQHVSSLVPIYMLLHKNSYTMWEVVGCRNE